MKGPTSLGQVRFGLFICLHFPSKCYHKIKAMQFSLVSLVYSAPDNFMSLHVPTIKSDPTVHLNHHHQPPPRRLSSTRGCAVFNTMALREAKVSLR